MLPDDVKGLVQPVLAHRLVVDLDRIVRQEGRLLFAEKLCVYDSVVIPNSLIYPV